MAFSSRRAGPCGLVDPRPAHESAAPSPPWTRTSLPRAGRRSSAPRSSGHRGRRQNRTHALQAAARAGRRARGRRGARRRMRHRDDGSARGGFETPYARLVRPVFIAPPISRQMAFKRNDVRRRPDGNAVNAVDEIAPLNHRPQGEGLNAFRHTVRGQKIARCNLVAALAGRIKLIRITIARHQNAQRSHAHRRFPLSRTRRQKTQASHLGTLPEI